MTRKEKAQERTLRAATRARHGLDRNKKGYKPNPLYTSILPSIPKPKGILARLWDWFTYCPPASCTCCGTKKDLTLSMVGNGNIYYLCTKHLLFFAEKGLLL